MKNIVKLIDMDLEKKLGSGEFLLMILDSKLPLDIKIKIRKLYKKYRPLKDKDE